MVELWDCCMWVERKETRASPSMGGGRLVIIFGFDGEADWGVLLVGKSRCALGRGGVGVCAGRNRGGGVSEEKARWGV